MTAYSLGETVLDAGSTYLLVIFVNTCGLIFFQT